MNLKLLILTALLSPLIYCADMSSEKQNEIAAQIDKLIDAGLKAQGIKANAQISDEVFLRRAYLDAIGRIPTLEEYNEFMNSKDPDRRNKVLDKIFDSKGYVSHNYNYWADALRAKLTYGKTHLDSYQLWIKQSIASNMRYDQFVKELLSAEGLLFQPGNGKVGYYVREHNMLLDNMSNTMQLFLATSIVCAQCHDHPYNEYTQLDYYKLAAFTNGTKLNFKSDRSLYLTDKKGKVLSKGQLMKLKKEGKLPESMMMKGNGSGAAREKRKIQRSAFIAMNHNGLGKINLPENYMYDDAKPNQEILADVPYGPKVKINYESSNGASKPVYNYKNDERTPYDKDVNSRKYFAEWVTSKENPMFTKTIVNRLWYRIWGVPLVSKLLDMRQKSMGPNPELTAYLIKTMQEINFDMKLFQKIILKTQSWQRASTEEVKGRYYFQGPVMQRISALQVYDSLLSTRVNDPDSTVIIPDYTENTAINEAVSTNGLRYFRQLEHDPKKYKPMIFKTLKSKGKLVLKYSGRGGRASEITTNYSPGSLIQIFGGSTREIIDEEVREANIPQTLYLMNDPDYAFGKTALAKDIAKTASQDEKIKMIYASVLTRKPTDGELKRIKKYLADGLKIDAIYWALINSHEFLLRM